ncbi:MAG: deoxynucleoside kinase, partial [Burkholderiales bacterium]|nr:deoxynucleoside kinase [Burkholderiales bacterium]
MSWPEHLRHVVIEGPIGVGKTSLARRLSAEIDADLLLEDADANPFLGPFYRDPARHALAAQLFFLFQRVDQLRDLAQADLFRRPTVSDFFFQKDALFAALTLSDDELGLYRKLHAHLAPQAPVPDLVVYLQASPRVLAARVRRRGLAREQTIDSDYLTRLADAYARFFLEYDAAPVLIVNSERLDFVDRAEDFALLLRRIAEMRG